MFRWRHSVLVTSSLLRYFGKTKRPRYAAGKTFSKKQKEEVPVSASGRRVKHFEELKFYHAKNRYGQNQTLVDSRRRDIDFFNPITGGYDRDPRSRYESSDSDVGSLDDDEAAAFANFTDTDDEDIYFGGGRDEDGDYDDEGNELRPKSSKLAKKSWADPDTVPFNQDKVEETDLDEDDREFNEVFGKRSATPKKGKRQNVKGNNEFRELSLNEDVVRKQIKKKNVSTIDPEIGLDMDSFHDRFKKKDSGKGTVSDKDFSPEDFLKDSDGEGNDFSDVDEEKLMQEGMEEMEEYKDVSEMIREYDRPRQNQRIIPITEEMVKARKRVEAKLGDEYDSDDVQIPHTEDPQRQKEIGDEYDANVKRLQSTAGGRNIWKNLNKEEMADREEFPPCGKELYENALRKDASIERAMPAPVTEKRTKKKKQSEKEAVVYVDKDHVLADAAKLKKSDSWRKLSIDFDDFVEDSDIYSDLDQERKENEKTQQIIEQQHAELRGKSPFGGTGIRRYSTSIQASRNQTFKSWTEESIALRYAEKLDIKLKSHHKKQLHKSEALREYWKSFPSDRTLQSAASQLLKRVKHPGRLYIAQLKDHSFVCGVAAPSYTVCGQSTTVDQFKPSTSDFVKLDLQRFRQMVQQGEIVTGGPSTGIRFLSSSSDWTGTPW